MSVHVVGDIGVKDFGGECVRIGDLSCGGAPDLLFVQSVYESRQVTCLTATSIDGALLRQVGIPSADRGRIYSDLPDQACDWDGDGRNEVLYVQQTERVDPVLTGGWARERAETYAGHATMLVLDARAGVGKRRFAIPVPADDCFLFADRTMPSLSTTAKAESSIIWRPQTPRRATTASGLMSGGTGATR